MGECKHEWEPHKNAFIKCKMCGANIVDFIIEQGKQIQQQEATIAAMRGAIHDLQKYIEFDPNSIFGISIKPDGVNLNSRAALAANSLINLYKTIESDTAGAELLEKIDRLERENKAMRNCANCNHSEFGYEGPECKLDCRRSYECEDNDLKHWQIAERLVSKR